MRNRLMIAISLAIGALGGLWASSGGRPELVGAQETPAPTASKGGPSEQPFTSDAQSARSKIIHDAEYYILDAQHGKEMGRR
jgi:hypothetical protein